nr:InlB B-repeat-containing protein [bacterium]
DEINDYIGEFDLENWTSYNYYISNTVTNYMYYKDVDINNDGINDYRGVYFSKYRPTNCSIASSEKNSHQDDWGYKTNHFYWFNYDLIEWNILKEENGKAFLLSNLYIDSQEYYNKCADEKIEHNDGLGYANNYELSNIRKWLNDTFYNTAFNDYQKQIILNTLIDNSYNQAIRGSEDMYPNIYGDDYSEINEYLSNNTNDNIFLLSFRELWDIFDKDNTQTIDTSLLASTPTDYAKSQAPFRDNNTNNTIWYLRTPGIGSNDIAHVRYTGNIEDPNNSNRPWTRLIYDIAGVRPALWINLDSNMKNIIINNENPTSGFVSVTGEISVPANESVMLEARPYSGYKFIGWFDGNDKLLSSNLEYIFVAKGNAIINAKFENASFDVKVANMTSEYDFVWDKGGTFEYNESVTLSFNPIPAYYIELYDSNNNKLDLDNNTYTFIMPSKDMIFYVYLKPITYNIVYIDEFDCANENKIEYTIETNTFTLIDLEKEGYTFDGWFNDSKKISQIEKGSMGDITLTASWTINKYNVTANSISGVTLTGLGEYDYSSEVTIGVSNTNVGYDVKLIVNGGLIGKNGATFIITNNVSILVSLELIKYTIDYSLPDIVENPGNPQTYTIDDVITLVDINHDGYVFGGWTLNGEVITKIENRHENLVLKPILTANKYTVNIINNTNGLEINGEGEHDYNSLVTIDIKNNTNSFALYFEYSYIVDGVTKNAKFTASKYDFYMPNYNMTVSVMEVVDQGYYYGTEVKQNLQYSNDDVVYFGCYPQTYVKNVDLRNSLLEIVGEIPTTTILNGWTDYGFIEQKEVKSFAWYKDITLDNYKYRAVYFTDYRPSHLDYKHSQVEPADEKYQKEMVHFFKFEPIPWRITKTSDGYTTLASLVCLDEQNYSIISNQFAAYDDSYIRSYLTTTLFNTAFDSSLIAYMQPVYNDDLISLFYDENDVWDHLNNTNYLKSSATDYALCIRPNTIGVSLSDEGGGTYYLRKRGTYEHSSSYRNDHAQVIRDVATDLWKEQHINKWTVAGIRPIIKINFEKYERIFIEKEIDGGTVTGQGCYKNGGTASLSVICNSDYEFRGWYDINGNLLSDKANYNYNVTGEATITAKFDKKYFITYENIFDGTNPNKSFIMENEIMTLENPTRCGYEFIGWTHNGEAITTIDGSKKEDITITANWTEATYNITYLNVDGLINENPLTYVFDSGNIELKNVSKEYYVFVGWFDEYDNLVETIINGTYGDITLTAKFEATKFSLELINKTDFTFDVDEFYSYGITVSIAPTNTISGYTVYFEYDDNYYLDNIEFNMPGSKATIIAYKVKVVDGYTVNDYYKVNVIKNIDEAGVVSDSYIYAKDEEITISTTLDTSYAFVGWTEDGNTNYISTELLFTYTVTKASSLTAVYAKKHYITYYLELDGATNNVNNPTYYTGLEDVTLYAATIHGYTFAGWFDGSKIISVIPKGSNTDITLTAKWNVNSYTVSANIISGITVNGLGSYEYDSEVNIIITDIPNEYKIKIENGDISAYNTYTFVLKDDTELVLTKEAIVYNITYANMEGATNNVNNPTTYTVDQLPVELLGATKDYYQHSGWLYNGVQLTDGLLPTNIYGDITVEAIWVANKYQVTLVNDTDVTVDGIESGSAYSYNSTITITTSNVPTGKVCKWVRSDSVEYVGNEYGFNMVGDNITIALTLIDE